MCTCLHGRPRGQKELGRKPKDMEARVGRNAAALKIQVSYTLANRLRSIDLVKHLN